MSKRVWHDDCNLGSSPTLLLQEFPMSTQLLPRFALRLLVPAIALGAMAMFGDPLPAPAQATTLLVQVETAQEAESLSLLTLRQEAEAAKKAARQTASQMRWFLTLPAAGNRRCSAPGCAS
jgi:hypothetical protein